MNDSKVLKVEVFLSWSGTDSASHAMAKALNDWIGKVHQYSKPFLSSDDIQAGERWGDVLGKQLSDSDFGILCITSESIKSPWLLFEAGVLSGSYRNPKRVVPYLLDIQLGDLKAPLGQFNSVVANKNGTYKLLQSLNNLPVIGPIVPENNLRLVFDLLWDELDIQINNARKLLKPL